MKSSLSRVPFVPRSSCLLAGVVFSLTLVALVVLVEPTSAHNRVSRTNLKLMSATPAAKGIVFRRISGCDYFIVVTKSGYDVLEWYGGHDPDRDDQLIGGFESYGFHDIYDETADEDLRIWTDDYRLSKEDALEKLTDVCG